jgi:hypothetical protein
MFKTAIYVIGASEYDPEMEEVNNNMDDSDHAPYCMKMEHVKLEPLDGRGY